MRVIDGMHRLRAACSKGRHTIEVRFFDGTAEEAFPLAVEANMAHGLPLAQEGRRAAALRIIASHPQLSDRAVARTSGLSAKTVAALRSTVADVAQHPEVRVGQDGRVRPLDSAEGRRKAAELLTECPHASLREVAGRAGISPATVSDVRKRLASQRPPVPDGTPPPQNTPAGRPGTAPPATVRAIRPVRTPSGPLLDKLSRDPSLRHRESGRQLLRLLQRHAAERHELLKPAETVPSHCADLVADLARAYANLWTEFAHEVSEPGRRGAARGPLSGGGR